jgi:hypothetical protein
VLYLIDYEQRTLVPLSDPRRDDLKPLSLEGTIAGRAFRTTSVLRSSSDESNGERLWLPLLDGTERLGVIDIAFDDGPVQERTVIVCECYAHLTAMLIATKAAYGDIFEVTRRREPMTIASELLWQLTPPLVFATDRLVLAGMLEPCYDTEAMPWTTPSTTGSCTWASSTPWATASRQPAWPPSPSRPTATAAVAAVGSWRPTPQWTTPSVTSSPVTGT